MMTHVALLRAINVGGRNLLPMRELTALLEELGLHGVRTYIQSGNAVFRSEEEDGALLADRIRAAILERRGFEPGLLMLGLEELEEAVRSNPFPDAEAEPGSLHLFFLAATPRDPDLAALERLSGDRERFALQSRVFYLHTPDGLGRSQLATRVERLLGVPATARNWRSVSRILEMARQ